MISFNKKQEKYLAIIFIIAFLFIFDFFLSSQLQFFINLFNSPQGINLPGLIVQIKEAIVEKPEVKRVARPEEVRGLYWTAYTAGSSRGEQLMSYIIASGLNTVVIDLKMDNGAIAFEPLNDGLKQYALSKPVIKDLEKLLNDLSEKNIYRIARIAVMRDGVMARTNPELALRWSGGSFWQDNIGSLWVDPAAPEVADYAIALTREAYARGFDEIQFDYIRFASDGKTSAIVYPIYDGTETKIEVMQNFFQKVGGTLQQEGIPVSFDLFGMTFWSNHDYNIGQRLIDVYPYTDYISPMVYPSHYYSGFRGHSNPALYPYDVVKSSLDRGLEVLEDNNLALAEEAQSKLRPWLQDFDLGAVYTAAMIEEQIRAAREAGCSGWLLWNARNVYQPANYLP